MLTAAHCVNGASPSSLYIRVGSSDPFASGGDSYAVNQIIVHPSYSGNSFDFALIEIDGSFEYSDYVGMIDLVTPEDVADGIQDAGVMATITGWGTTSSGGSLSSTLQMVEAPIVVNNVACGFESDSNGNSGDYGCSQLNESMICAGDLINGGEDACQGDSGGPLAVRNAADTKWVLIGATSWGNGCANVNYPGVWSKVSYVLDWIDANADVNSDNGCMDVSACNYDAEAIYDDGSCAELDECGDCGGNGPAVGLDCDGNCISGETLVLTLSDSYGDGWDNGSAVIIDADGNEVFSGTVAVSETTETLCLEDGSYTITVGGSSYLNEMSFVLGDIVSGGNGSYNFVVGDAPITGCTDATALNYNPSATIDDDSCIPVIEGCMDADYVEYNMDANVDDGSCLTINCEGTIITMGGGSYISETSFIISNCDGSEIISATAENGEYCIVLPANYSITMSDSYGDGWNGNVLTIGTQSYTIDTGSSNYVEVGTCPIYGCTDETAFNYDPAAELDDASCIAVLAGCIDPIAANYNADATTDDGSCTYISGCTDNTAVNFNPAASIDDGSCNYVSCLQTSALLTFTMGFYPTETSISIIDANGQELANMNGGNETSYTNDLCLSPENSYTAILMDTYGDGWNGATFSISTCDGSLIAVEGTLETGSLDSITFAIQSCDSYVFGCMDSIASNFDPLATDDDESCTYLGCTDPMYLEFDALFTDDDGSCVTLIVEGCMNMDASNYNMYANLDDGSCLLPIVCEAGLVGMIIYMADSYGDGWNGNEYTLLNSMGDLISVGKLQAGSNAQDILCIAADCYVISVGGGSYINEVSWSISTEYNGASITNGAADAVAFSLGSDADCSVLLGCTDPMAENYSMSAIKEDGSCTYIEGCMDDLATNYNPAATSDDGSCEYISSVTCEEAITMDLNSSSNGSFNEQIWYSITLESLQSVSATAMPAAGFAYEGDVVIMTACDSTGVTVVQGALDAGTYFISVTSSIIWANGDGYVLTISAADVVEGCSDLYASNYNELVNVDDGSCLYPCKAIATSMTINTVSYGEELYWELLNSEGAITAYGGPYDNNTSYEVPLCLTEGSDYTMNTYDSWGDGWNGGTYEVVATCGEDALTAFTYIAANNGGASPTDAESIEVGGYHLESSEVFTVIVCADVVAGCMDETMFNYDPLANVSSGMCISVIYGCMNADALNYNADANTDDDSCVLACYGEYLTVSVTTGSWASEVTWELLSSSGDTLMFGEGLANSTAYSESICLATEETYTFSSHDSYGDGWNGGFFSIVSCETIVYGGIEQVGGAPAGSGADYQFTLVSCADIVPGCTNVQAENYDAVATHSDGSCIFTMPNILTPSCGTLIDLATADSTVFTWEALISEEEPPASYYFMWSTDPTDLEGSVAIYLITASEDSLKYVDTDGL